MKIWIISDSHFGKYSLDSDKWLNNMKSYFYDFLIPILKENKKLDDKLFFLGDLYDNRTSINLKVLNVVIKLFEDLSEIIECHLLIGNHDNFNMSDAEINSVCTIRNIKNVYTYQDPKIITFDNLDMLMMPWIHGKNREKTILEKYAGSDLLFCHSDLNGCRTQLYPTRPFNRQILDITDFKGYNKVYSGHIHIVQEINNFKFVGSPYHLDRNDIGNKKGIWVYDTKKKTDLFIENDFSPEFKKIKIYKENDFINLNTELKNNINFIDLEISNNLLINSPHLRLELDKITNKHRIENIEFIDDIVKEKIKRVYNYTKDKSIKDISHDWTDQLKLNEETDLFNEIELKNKMKEKIEECFSLMELNKK